MVEGGGRCFLRQKRRAVKGGDKQYLGSGYISTGTLACELARTGGEEAPKQTRYTLEVTNNGEKGLEMHR